MKKFVFTILIIGLSSVYLNAQTIKTHTKDSASTYKANDRLRNAGPKNGWPASTDSSKTKVNAIKPALDSVSPANKRKVKRVG